jgi:glycosyltransferase involved in cell wall biosynthesis
VTRILSVSFSPLRRDSRVLRQVAVLREFGEVTTVGYGAAPDGVTDHVEIPEKAASLPQTLSGVALLGLHRHRAVELRSPAERIALPALRDRARFDLVIANDARALPLAFAVADGAPVWADLHEWAPEENSTVLAWRLLVGPYMAALCARYLARTAATSTVGGAIAGLYRTHYGVEPLIVRNAGPWQDLEPTPVEPGRVRLVHSGIAVPERNIEALIDAMHVLPERFTLDLYLVGTPAYVGKLRSRAGGSTRITFHPPVHPTELPRTLNGYDLGVYLLPLRTLNHHLMLPNKFFDFVQARLGMLISPAEETAALIARHDLGPALPDHSVEGLVAALSPLSDDDITRFKRSADAAAREMSSATDDETIRTIVRRLL